METNQSRNRGRSAETSPEYTPVSALYRRDFGGPSQGLNTSSSMTHYYSPSVVNPASLPDRGRVQPVQVLRTPQRVLVSNLCQHSTFDFEEGS